MPYNNLFYTTSLLNHILNAESCASAERNEKICIKTEDNKVVFKCWATGLDKKDIEVKIQNDVLNITSIKEDKEKDYFVSAFDYRYKVSDSLNKKGLKAKLRSGILEVTIPFKEEVSTLYEVDVE